MNYLIFDTEQTYNYGFIVVNSKGEKLHRTNLVLINNFENRSLIGENTYKRKKPIYEKDPDAKFMGSGEGAEYIKSIFEKYNITQIISHNISEDRRQLELLSQQTGVKFAEIPFYDSINLVKVLFPNNTQTGLEAIISDITGIDVKQTHTALQDCDLLYNLIFPIIEYLPCFINYKDIFAHDSNYEITKKFFTNLDFIFPLPATFEDIQEKIGMNTSTGDKRTSSNFLKETSHNLWKVEEYTKYGAKGNALKTPGLRIAASSEKATEDLILIGNLFSSLDKIADKILTSCVQYQASQETDESINERLEKYKTLIKNEYQEKENALIKREETLIKTFQTKTYNLENEYQEKENALIKREEWIKMKLMSKLDLALISGGLFNAELRELKNIIRNKDIEGLYNYFMK